MTLLPTRRRPPRGVCRMGMTEVRVRVVNLADASRFAEIDMVVDSGDVRPRAWRERPPLGG